jgi:hypothetical protein
MPFREFTLVHPEPYCEVMADINTETGELIGLYCYADNIPVIENIETGYQYRIRTKPGKNPLFVHIQSKKNVFTKLILNGYTVLLDEEDSQYQQEVTAIEKAISLCNIPAHVHPY